MTARLWVDEQRARVADLFSNKLGRCSKCIRASVQGAVLGWIAVTAIVVLLPDRFHMWYLVLLWPISFTILWLSHIGAYAARGISAQEKELLRESAQGSRRLTRREMVGVFLNNATFAVAASATLLLTPWQLQAMCYDHGQPCTCHGQGCCDSTDKCGGTFPNTTCDTWQNSCD